MRLLGLRLGKAAFVPKLPFHSLLPRDPRGFGRPGDPGAGAQVVASAPRALYQMSRPQGQQPELPLGD